MNCFGKNYIGIVGQCDGMEPETGLYINDLPGITIERAAALADIETNKGIELLRKTERIAVSKLKSDFLAGLKVELNDIVDSVKIGEWYSSEYYDFFNNPAGIEVEVDSDDRYLRPYIEYIEIYAKGIDTKDSAQRVFTIVDGAKTKEVTARIRNGKNRIRLDYMAECPVVQVYADLCSVQLRNELGHDFCDCTGYCAYECNCFKVRGIGNVNGETEYTRTYNGFSASIACCCDPSELMCQFKKLLARPYLYAWGLAIMEEIINTDNVNPILRNNKEEAGRLLTKWGGGKDPLTEKDGKGEYYNELQKAINQANKTLSKEQSICLSCEGLRAQSMV